MRWKKWRGEREGRKEGGRRERGGKVRKRIRTCKEWDFEGKKRGGMKEGGEGEEG